MNKKATFAYNLVLVVVLIMVLVFTSYKLLTNKIPTQTKNIGEIQADVINDYVMGEKSILFLQQSFRYSQGEVLVNFYNNGGYHDDPCGANNGYNLYYKGSQNCLLDQKTLMNELSKVYTDQVNKYSLN